MSLEYPECFLSAEPSFIGALICNLETGIEDALDILGDNGDMFEDERHKWVYVAILNLHQGGDPVNMSTLWWALVNLGVERKVGAAYLAELIDHSPTSHNIRFYARKVQADHLTRNLVKTCAQTGSGLNKGNIDNEEALAKLESVVMTTLNQSSHSKPERVGSIIPRVISGIRERHEMRGEMIGIPTGLNHLDRSMEGFRPETLNVLAARPSVGKSALAVNFALNAAFAGHPVLFFSLEMGRESLVKRFLSIKAATPWKTLSGTFQVDIQSYRINQSFEKLKSTEIFIVDNERLDVFRLRSAARRFAAAHYPKMPLFVIDYLQLCVRGIRSDQKRHEAVGEFTRECKALSRELHCPVLLLSQLSREAEKRDMPFHCMDCLKDSGNTEEDADTIMVVIKKCQDKSYEDAAKKKISPDSLLNFGLIKNREGETCADTLYFNKETQVIQSLSDYGTSQSDGFGPPVQQDIENDYFEDDDTPF